MKDNQKCQSPMKKMDSPNLQSPLPKVSSSAVSEDFDMRINIEKNNRMKSKSSICADCFHFLLRIVVIAVLGLIVFTKVFLITQASGSDMFPSIKDGDLVLAFRAQRDYAKNDVVVYSCEQGNRIGRIAALGGDIVTLDDSGILIVNGTVQNGEILYLTFAKDEITYPYKVPEGSIFILGDYRSSAQDSRDYGSIPMENVKGKVITILRRRGL